MTRAQKKHYKNKKSIIRMKIYDLEFLRYQLKSMREGLRMEYDRIKENMDAAKRRLAGEQYRFFYCASNDEIDYKSIPILPDDFEKLPDKAEDTKDFRFYKKPRKEVDQKVCENLKGMIQKYSDDSEQLGKQMEGLDGQIDGPGGVVEKMDGMQTAINLLNEYINLKV